MTTGYTVFVTYIFEDTPASASTSYGYSTALHCNYIQTITADSLRGKALNMYFPTINELSFLAGTGSTNGTGFTATKLFALVQIQNGISDSGTTIKPNSNGWFKVNLTDQINNLDESNPHIIGSVINKEHLVNSLFKIEFTNLNVPYTLDYLNYPSNVAPDNVMGFGEEAFFFGNVETDIRASVYTTDIPINLPLNNYNTSTNPTWDGQSSVGISEIGIYDSNNNLVAIGKLNYPITKNGTIARTIAFQLDF